MSDESDDKAPGLLALIWILSALSLFIILARFYTRRFVVKLVDLDDLLMAASWCFGLIFCIFITLSCQWGLGKHFWTLDGQHQVNAMHWNFTAQPFGIIAGTVGRISFSVSLLRIIGPADRTKKMILCFLIVFQVLVNASTIILIFVQCGEIIDAIWDPSLVQTAGAKCWSPDVQTYYGFFQSSVNAATDLALTILPLWVIWNMQLKPAIKVTLAFLLGLSVLALVATVVKTYQLKNISVRMDFTTNIVGLYIWTSVEFAVVIIAASIPTLKPLFRGRMFNKSSSKGNAYKLSHTPNKPSRNQSYKSAGWDFGTFDTVARHQGDSSSEQNILPADNYTDLCAQDIRKTTVITVDRENGSMGSAGESRKFGSRQESREPSVEPPRLWAEGHEV